MRVFLFAALCAGLAVGQDMSQTARYSVSFQSRFCDASNFAGSGADACPPNPHMSPLFGGAHNPSAYELYRVGSVSSDGLKALAETGSTSSVSGEWAAGDTLASLTGSSIFGVQSRAMGEFPADQQHARASFCTMIAPSPDWMLCAGVTLYSNVTGWISSATLNMLAYDAGTDSGATYTAANAPQTPRVPLSLLQLAALDPANNNNVFPGTLTFTKVSGSPSPSSTTSGGSLLGVGALALAALLV